MPQIDPAAALEKAAAYLIRSLDSPGDSDLGPALQAIAAPLIAAEARAQYDPIRADYEAWGLGKQK